MTSFLRLCVLGENIVSASTSDEHPQIYYTFPLPTPVLQDWREIVDHRPSGQKSDSLHAKHPNPDTHTKCR